MSSKDLLEAECIKVHPDARAKLNKFLEAAICFPVLLPEPVRTKLELFGNFFVTVVEDASLPSGYVEFFSGVRVDVSTL